MDVSDERYPPPPPSKMCFFETISLKRFKMSGELKIHLNAKLWKFLSSAYQ